MDWKLYVFQCILVCVAFEVEYASEFDEWWNELSVAEQISIARNVSRLIDEGPALSRPYADTVYGSKFPNMKELRVQHEGRPIEFSTPSIQDDAPCC
jgi:hypothetical protein